MARANPHLEKDLAHIPEASMVPCFFVWSRVCVRQEFSVTHVNPEPFASFPVPVGIVGVGAPHSPFH